MKILELRLRNLNSLYGEWRVDFTEPQYSEDGLFALVGPTGAGKSTILDAICLALYGATPRLGKITKSSNEIMSRGTGDCYAEVLLQSKTGIYRCHWEQRRARKNPEGKLQEQEHQIIEEATGIPLEAKKSQTLKLIEEKTGMDFDRFTRSILLAQGDFDNFLRASSEDKSKILEQITGTQIYSEISKRVHAKHREHKDGVEKLKIESSGIELLEPEEITQIRQDLEQFDKESGKIRGRLKDVQREIHWHNQIIGLRAELASLAVEKDKLDREIKEFEEDRRRLGKAELAVAYEGDYATLGALYKQHSNLNQKLKDIVKWLPQMEVSTRALSDEVEKLKTGKQQCRIAVQEAAPKILQARQLDSKLTDAADALKQAEIECTSAAKSVETLENKKRNLLSQKVSLAQKLSSAQSYLEKHSRDERLVSSYSAIKEKLKNLAESQDLFKEAERKLSEGWGELKLAIIERDEASRSLAVHDRQLIDLNTQLQTKERVLEQLLDSRTLRDIRAEKDSLLRELALITRITELEAERKHLRDGVPCPLCGAKEHPYAAGNIPTPCATEQKIAALEKLINEADRLGDEIKTLNGQITVLSADRDKSQKEVELLGVRLNEKQRYCAELEKTATGKKAAAGKLEDEILVEISPLGFSGMSGRKVPDILQELEQRRSAWLAARSSGDTLSLGLTQLQGEIGSAEAVGAELLKRLERSQGGLSEQKNNREKLQQQRYEIFGDKSPDEEEVRLANLLSAAEAELEKSTLLANREQQKLKSARDQKESFEKELGVLQTQLMAEEERFLEKIKHSGFIDREDFESSRLTPEERAVLKEKAQTFDSRSTTLQARLDDGSSRLAKELLKNTSDRGLEESKRVQQSLEEQILQIQESASRGRHRIEQDEHARNKQKDKLNLLRAAEQELSYWDGLHVLVGSADGKKYRNFAQGCTFEVMVHHANLQLSKMTDRYLLIRDTEAPLELNVVDNYQAGEIRTTKNLSGGESFLVSLALALGLSKMASQKVQVDSLFLDEGFGTLDESALESALETLASLQEGGKIIGVISHISELKDRIAAQITVLKKTGGKSTLSGPGCKFLGK